MENKVINMRDWIRKEFENGRNLKNIEHAKIVLHNHLVLEAQQPKDKDTSYKTYLEEFNRLLGVGE